MQFGHSRVTVVAYFHGSQDEGATPLTSRPMRVTAPEIPAFSIRRSGRPVTIDAAPAEIGDLESFAARGLHGISENRLHVSDFYKHARSGSI